MYADDEEEDQIQKIKIPAYRIIHMEIEISKKEQSAEVLNTTDRINANTENKKEENKINFVEKILEYATVSLEGCEFDKDVASKLKRKLDEDPEMNNPSVSNAEKNIEEYGVWQVIVGRQYVASVTFDAKNLIYFLFEDLGKYFLIFRS